MRDVIAADLLQQRRIDALDGGAGDGSSLAPARGERDGQPAAVLGIDLARDIAAQGQRIDELSRGLLRDAQTVDDLRQRRPPRAERADHENAVLRNVVETGLDQRDTDGIAIGEPCRPQQGGENHGLIGGTFLGHDAPI